MTIIRLPKARQTQSLQSGGGSRTLNPSVIANQGDLGGTLLQVVDELDRFEATTASHYASKETASALSDLSEEFITARQQATGMVENFTPDFLQQVTARRDDILERAPNAQARLVVSDRFQRIASDFEASALQFESDQRQMVRGENFATGISQMENALFNNPDLATRVLTQADGDLTAAESLWMTPAMAAAWRREIPGRLSVAVMRGEIARDPEAALAALSEQSGDGENSNLTVARLTLDQRQALMGSARAELARRREATNGVRQIMKDDIRDVIDQLESGRNPGEARLQVLNDQARAIGDAELVNDMQSAENLFRFQREATTWTPVTLQDWVNTEEARLRNRDGESPAESDRILLARNLLTEMKRELKRDPLAWAQRTGTHQVEALALTGDGAVNSMRARAAVGQQVSGYFGTPRRYLSDEEAGQITQSFRHGSIDEKLALAATLHRGFGNALPDVLDQVSELEPVTAHLAALASMGPRQAAVAREAFHGLEIISDQDDGMLPDSGTRRAWQTRHMGTAGAALDDVRSNILETATAIYASRAVHRGLTAMRVDEDLWETATNEAAGAHLDNDGVLRGGIGEWNDYDLILPVELSEDEFVNLLESITPVQLKQASVGGAAPAHGNGEAFTPDDLEDARLVEAGPGQYRIDMGDRTKAWIRGSGKDGYYVLDVGVLLRGRP